MLLLEDAETQEQMPVIPAVVTGGYRERMRQHVGTCVVCGGNHSINEMLTTKQPLDFAVVLVFIEAVWQITQWSVVRVSGQCVSGQEHNGQ